MAILRGLILMYSKINSLESRNLAWFLCKTMPLSISRNLRRNSAKIWEYYWPIALFTPWFKLYRTRLVAPESKGLGDAPRTQGVRVSWRGQRALEKTLIEARELIDETIIEPCLESTYRRRDAVITAKWWHIKHWLFRGLGIWNLN
jgi:hypothetical protein